MVNYPKRVLIFGETKTKTQMRTLLQHTETENSTYGFNLLNDRQRFSICENFDFLHCSINEDLQGGEALLRTGEKVVFKLSMIGVK